MLHSILVSFVPDGDFISLTTLSRRYHRSPRFLMSLDIAKAFMDGNSVVLYDCDLNNFLSAHYIDDETLLFRVSWLNNTGNDQLMGHQETFEIPAYLLADAINGAPGKHLTSKAVTQCPIILKPSAYKIIASLDQLERRALSKALRDNWHWSYPEPVTLYADWDKGFYFTTSTLCGGLCRHADTVLGTDRKPHLRIRYSVYT